MSWAYEVGIDSLEKRTIIYRGEMLKETRTGSVCRVIRWRM